MTSADGMKAFVPNGDSRRDTAILLLGAARDHGLDDSRAVVAAPGGFYISDELADLLGSDPDIDTDEVDADEPDESDAPDGDNPETEKAVDQLEAEVPPVENAEEAVDKAVVAPAKAAKKAAKRTSGNRAAKQDSEEE